MRRIQSVFILAILISMILILAKQANAREEPTTRPATTQSTLSFEDLLKKFVYDEDRSYDTTKWWKKEQQALAAALVAIVSEDRFLTETTLRHHRGADDHYSRFYGPFNALKDLSLRQQVTAALLPLLDSPECDKNETIVLGRTIMNSGGQPSLALLEQVSKAQRKFEEGERDETANHVLHSIQAAAEESRFTPSERDRAFDLINQVRLVSSDRHYLEVLAALDPKRTAELLATEGFLNPDHPEHARALPIANEYSLKLPVNSLVDFLKIHPTSATSAEERVKCGSMLIMLANTNPGLAEQQANRMIKSSQSNADFDEATRREWKLIAFIGQLHARGANRYLDYDMVKSQPALAWPESLIFIARVNELMANLASPDIGRYFFESTPETLIIDHAALEKIGAKETSQRLIETIKAFGGPDAVNDWQQLRRTVDELGPAKVQELDTRLKKTPDDLVVLMIEYQLAHAEEIKVHLDVSDAAMKAKTGVEPGKLGAGYYLIIEKVFRDSCFGKDADD